jgi:hypothetical protein
MALVKQGALPAKLKGAGGPASGYGSDVNAPKMSKTGGGKKITGTTTQAFCGGGSVQGGFRNNAMKSRK